MKPSQAVIAIDVAFKANRPTMIWGAPGIGKSDMARQIALQYAKQFVTHKVSSNSTADELVKDVRLLLMNPVHLNGIPDLQKTSEGKKTVFTRPDVVITEDEPYVVLFLDEITAAPPSVQAAAYQLVLDRRIGNYRLPDYVRIICAGNRRQDRSVSNEMPLALKTRMFHISLEVDTNDWILWALDNNIAPEIVAFIKMVPSVLHVMPGETRELNGNVVTFPVDSHTAPTPRGWHMLSDFLKAGIPDEFEIEVVEGIIGKGVANVFAGFRKIYRQLPNPTAVLMAPDTATVPNKSDARWAISVALAHHVNENTLANALKYMQRITDSSGNVLKEYETIFMLSVSRIKPELQHTVEYNRWAAQSNNTAYAS
jgi:hypothetical protein